MDLNILTIITVIVSAAAIIYLLRPKPVKEDTATLEWLKSMEKRLDQSGKTINESLAKQTEQMLVAQRAIYSKLQESAKTIGEMSEIGKSMQDLQQFLASPKLRGGLGEQVLKDLLADSLPKANFSLQYTFRSGAKVDAAIKTGSGIIPIDSKFSMENFKKMHTDKTFEKDFVRDVKDRIDEISKKYILTDEGTVDFALMYVPSESVYYEIVNNETDLMAYAYKQRVMPVSPSTFYAFLRSVMLSFEGQKIASEIRTIQQALRAIHTETSKFGDLLSTLQSHVTNAYSMMNRVATSFVGLSSKVESVQGLGVGEKKKELPEET